MPDTRKVTRQDVESFAVSMQQLKTEMEHLGFQDDHWDAYWNLSQAIYALEVSSGIIACELRDRMRSAGSNHADS